MSTTEEKVSVEGADVIRDMMILRDYYEHLARGAKVSITGKDRETGITLNYWSQNLTGGDILLQFDLEHGKLESEQHKVRNKDGLPEEDGESLTLECVVLRTFPGTIPNLRVMGAKQVFVNGEFMFSAMWQEGEHYHVVTWTVD